MSYSFRLILYFPFSAVNLEKETEEKEISPNQTFYENLPFSGLKNPPKKVTRQLDKSHPVKETIQVLNRESCDYADCDYADYADGPLGYHATSKLQAGIRKVENEEKQF